MSSLCEWSSRERVEGVLTMPSERLGGGVIDLVC